MSTLFALAPEGSTTDRSRVTTGSFALSAQLAELPSSVVVRPWADPVIDKVGYDVRSVYAEMFYLSVVGPTSLWLLRRLVAGLEHYPDGYELGSPIHYADGLAGDLLLVHGTGDDNVHFQGTERLIDKLVELGNPFDLMVYPNRTHAISEGKGTSLHLYSLLARYLDEHLARRSPSRASTVATR